MGKWGVDVEVWFWDPKTVQLMKFWDICGNTPLGQFPKIFSVFGSEKQESQHPLTGQRAANFWLLANQ